MTKRATTGKTEQERIVAAVKAWQSSGHVHPLTCAKDSRGHRLLEPVVEGDSVILACPDCDYRQFKIPDVVTSTTVPAIDLDFKMAVTRLLGVKPERPLTAKEKRSLAADAKAHDRKAGEMQDLIVVDDEPN